MFFIISGAAMLVVTCAFYWYLLPRDGKVHPLVQNSDVGSMITIVIMGMFTFGVALLCDGLFG